MSRKWRWSFEAEFPFGRIESSFVRIAARPDTDGVNTDGVKELTITYFDLNASKESLFKSLGMVFKPKSIFDIGGDPCYDTINEKQHGTGKLTLMLPTAAKCPNCNVALNMFDSSGPMVPFEMWTLIHMYPYSYTYGEMDYSNGENVVEVTWRYADVHYQNLGPSYEMFNTKPYQPPTDGSNLSMGLGKIGDFLCKCDKNEKT